MPIAVLLISLALGVSTIGFILNAIEEHPIYWLPAILFCFLTVAEFMKFLAMC